MTTVPRRIISASHMDNRVWDCKFTNVHPVLGIQATIAFTLGIRNEVALSTDYFNLCPARGIVTRVVAESVGGGVFDIEITDKPFGTSTPAPSRVVYSETPVTDFTNKANFGESPYQLQNEPDLGIPFLPTLYAGITPTTGAGIFIIHVYVLSRS